MSLSTQTLKRLPTIKAGLLKGLSYPQIGTKCGVTEKTIDRDVQAWYRSGDYESWLWQEWLRLHVLVLQQEGPSKPYEQVTKLIARMMTRKMEVKEEIKIEEKRVAILAEYTGAINSATERDIQALRTRKQMDTTPTNTETS